jgi:hypothetical protein
MAAVVNIENRRGKYPEPAGGVEYSALTHPQSELDWQVYCRLLQKCWEKLDSHLVGAARLNALADLIYQAAAPSNEKNLDQNHHLSQARMLAQMLIATNGQVESLDPNQLNVPEAPADSRQAREPRVYSSLISHHR